MKPFAWIAVIFILAVVVAKVRKEERRAERKVDPVSSTAPAPSAPPPAPSAPPPAPPAPPAKDAYLTKQPFGYGKDPAPVKKPERKRTEQEEIYWKAAQEAVRRFNLALGVQDTREMCRNAALASSHFLYAGDEEQYKEYKKSAEQPYCK